MSLATLVTGILIFLARVCDVSLGTVRTIATVQGRLALAFVLGLFEVVMWLIVISAIVDRVIQNPWLILFYAFGFSTGNVVGILLERKLALGDIILHLYVEENRAEVIEAIKNLDFSYTIFRGEGRMGPVVEIYVVCERKDLREILSKIRDIDPDIFYTTEIPGTVNRVRRKVELTAPRWRALNKRK